jgi:uncharacterized protein YndB with AHSA1/START domain
MSEATIHIDADPTAVYELVADVTRMGEWSPETVSAQWLDGASGPAVGAKFKGKNKRKMSWSTTCTVIAADAGQEFAFDVGSGDTRWRYRFESSDGGTEVTESCEILKQPGALMRVLTKLGTGVRWDEREADIEKGMQTTLANLKAKAEAS